MDSENLSRLNEKDRNDFEMTFQKASKIGKNILDMLLSALIASHDANFQLDNTNPPSFINNYNLDNYPYSLEVDKEFEQIMCKLDSIQYDEARNQYKNSSPQEKVLLKQFLYLTEEMHKLQIRGVIRNFLKEGSPEEVPLLLEGETLPLKLNLEELMELVEREKILLGGNKNIGKKEEKKEE